MTIEDIKTITDIVHKTIYGFFDVCGDDEETPMTDKDKLLLKINKALCTNIKALKQEPCGDVISCETVIEWLKDKDIIKLSSQEETARKELKALPPVTVAPCGDVITFKKDALDAISRIGLQKSGTKEVQAVAECLRAVEALSPVTPQPRWIPVSERLPEENKTVIASTTYGVYPETRYTKEYGWEWAYEAGADYWRELKDVLAWMPLPGPYKAESEE